MATALCVVFLGLTPNVSWHQYLICLSCKKNKPGLFPDYMHIMHLACCVDAVVSIIMDLVDETNIEGTSRDAKLEKLWLNYKKWADDTGPLQFCQFFNFSCFLIFQFFNFLVLQQGAPDRASKRFFHTSVLRPKGGAKNAEVSQKLLSATALRYMLFWINSLLAQINTNDLAGQFLDIFFL